MALEVRDLGRTIGADVGERTIIRGVSFLLERGGVIGVTGPSGSGKTSLLRVVMALDAKSSGAVLLDGIEREAMPIATFRRRVAMVPQDVPEWPDTPIESLAKCRAFDCRRGVDEVVDPESQLTSSLDQLGMDRKLAERPWRSLSGGQRRRVHGALAAALRPEYLLLDEPAAGLDRESTRALAGWMSGVAASGVGVLFAAHDELLLARVSHHLLILFDGEVHAEGPPERVISSAVAAVRQES
jgi:ABC-type cobalamin/Fe3+-siderophores transport system ATPase subunit